MTSSQQALGSQIRFALVMIDALAYSTAVQRQDLRAVCLCNVHSLRHDKAASGRCESRRRRKEPQGGLHQVRVEPF